MKIVNFANNNCIGSFDLAVNEVPSVERAAGEPITKFVFWNEASEARLKELWAAGRSGSEIVAAFNHQVTRSAVIAKVNRLKLNQGARQRDQVKLRLRAGIVEDRTLTNIIKAVIDQLAERCVIKPPTCVSDLDVRWDRTIEPGRVAVDIWEAVAPTRRLTAVTPQRIADAQRKRWAAYR
jgi:hypothetical protein